MATLDVRTGFQTNMLKLDFAMLFEGAPTTTTTRRFVIESGEVRVDFRGFGFKYGDDGMPKAGTVSGFALSRNCQVGLTFDELDVSMKALLRTTSTLDTGDDHSLLYKMLLGKDQITGADREDTLEGGERKDLITGGGASDFLLGV